MLDADLDETTVAGCDRPGVSAAAEDGPGRRGRVAADGESGDDDATAAGGDVGPAGEHVAAPDEFVGGPRPVGHETVVLLGRMAPIGAHPGLRPAANRSRRQNVADRLA